MIREIIFYETLTDKCPVKDFLAELDSKTRAKVAQVFQLIEELPVVPKKFLEKLIGTDDIWEVRISFNKNIYRIFGFFQNSKLIVLTHGYQKKTNKVDRKEIIRAEKYKKDYLYNIKIKGEIKC